MKLKELETLFNEKLKSLEGKTFKTYIDLCALKSEVIADVASEFGLTFRLHSLDCMLGDDFAPKKNVKIFNFKKSVFFNTTGGIPLPQ